MRHILTLAAAACLTLTASCGSDDAAPGDSANQGAGTAGERASIVVTTNILGDVVEQVLGDLADVEVVMPLGADPHDFAPSARQAESMEDADLLVVNGAGFEEGMSGVIDSVTDGGTPVFAFADAVELLEAGAGGHREEGDDEGHVEGEEHADDTGGAHAEEEGDEHGAVDPHLWTDPMRIVAGVRGLADALAAVEGIDATALAGQVDAYVAELEALDADIERTLAVVPADRRVLVTNHEVFAYFADRYDFEVVGAVVPSLSTAAETSVREIEELAELIEAEGVRVIFAETTQSTDLAEALAEQAGGEIEIVELFTESLGGPGSGAETYVELMGTNAGLVAGALGSA